MSETPPCGAGADQARKLLSAARGSVCASKHPVGRAQELVEGAPHPGPVGTHRLRTAGALTRVRQRPGHREERTGRDQPTSDGQVLPFPVKVDLRLPRETLLALVAVPPPSELDRGRRKRPGRPAGSVWRTLPAPPRRAGRAVVRPLPQAQPWGDLLRVVVHALTGRLDNAVRQRQARLEELVEDATADGAVQLAIGRAVDATMSRR